MIIETKKGIFVMIPHAVDAMNDENITGKEIRDALEKGNRDESYSSARDVYIYNGIVAVVDETDEIVTVYRV